MNRSPKHSTRFRLNSLLEHRQYARTAYWAMGQPGRMCGSDFASYVEIFVVRQRAEGALI